MLKSSLETAAAMLAVGDVRVGESCDTQMALLLMGNEVHSRISVSSLQVREPAGNSSRIQQKNLNQIKTD